MPWPHEDPSVQPQHIVEPALESTQDPHRDPVAAATALLGRVRDPAEPLPRIEGRGPAVVEVAQLWGDALIDVRHIAPDRQGRARLTIGEEADLFTPASGLPHDGFALVECEGGDVSVQISDRWGGWRIRGDERTPLAALSDPECEEPVEAVSLGVLRLPLRAGDQVFLQIGELAFLLRLAAPGAKVAGRVSKDVDLPFLAILSSAVGLGAIMAAAIAISPPPTESAVVDLPDRFAEVYLSVPPKPEVKVASNTATNPDAGEGKKRADEEGRTGRKEGKRQAKGGKALQREIDKQVAENAGLLGYLADSGALAGVFDSNSLSGDLTQGIGGLHGAVGVQMGTGYGLNGRGPGGGGNEIGSFTGTGTRGRSDGSSGDFSGGGDLGPKGDGPDLRAGGPPITIGGLDKSLIDAVVKRHMNQFKFCYQRELTKNPSLGGKVAVQFVIAKDGSVSKAKVKSSSLGSQAVESCMTDRFLRLSFPEPAGGGIVIVTYPFMFSPG
ncbi:MAG: energy transducer TonB [Alphaproteobacteria bacterium]|nr:energy transducer TonB [Alphaproteobacteria bacterium]